MRKLLLIGILIQSISEAYSQVEFTLQSSELIPHDEGFFLGGVSYDFNGDGLDEFINGCPGDFDFEDYERRNPAEVTYDLHTESGEQFGFTYKNCMILPVCEAKYPSELEPALSSGFIQMRPLIDTTDTDLMYSYILSPEISNLQSITMETSADVSIQPDRRLIPYNIEYSIDGGETFVQDYYISDVVAAQGGYRVTYDAETNEDFAQIQSDSKTKNVILRFVTNVDNSNLGAYKGQYVKVHKIVVVADSAMTTSGEIILSNAPTLLSDPILIRNGYASVESGTVTAYTISGQFIGSGDSVKLGKGLNVLTTNSGFRKKVFIK